MGYAPLEPAEKDARGCAFVYALLSFFYGHNMRMVGIAGLHRVFGTFLEVLQMKGVEITSLMGGRFVRIPHGFAPTEEAYRYHIIDVAIFHGLVKDFILPCSEGIGEAIRLVPEFPYEVVSNLKVLQKGEYSYIRAAAATAHNDFCSPLSERIPLGISRTEAEG